MKTKQLHNQNQTPSKNHTPRIAKRQPLHFQDTSTIPYQHQQDFDLSSLNTHNDTHDHSPYPIHESSSFQPYRPQKTLPLKPSKHQKSYTLTLQETLHQQTILNVEQIIFQNTQIIQNLHQQNQRLQTHLQNLKQLFHLNRLNHSEQYPLKQEEPVHHIKNTKPIKRPLPDSPLFKEIQRTKPEIKKKVKIDQSSILQDSNLQGPSKNQPKSNLFKGCFKYTNQSWAIQQNYVMRFLQLWLKDNIQKVQDGTGLTIDKKIIMGCYENWKNFQQFPIQSNLKTATIQQILTNEVKAFFKCSCNHKDFIGLEFTKEDFKNFTHGEKYESNEQNFEDTEVNKTKLE